MYLVSGHRFPLFLAGRLLGLHDIVERSHRNSTGRTRNISDRSYAYGEPGLVRINGWTWWDDKIRARRPAPSSPLAARPGPRRIEKSMSPKTLQEVERAIGALTAQEVQELYVWLEQHFPQPMDARLLSDLSAGRLDTAIQRALDDEKNGRLRPL